MSNLSRYPVVTSEFMKAYDHAVPSGHGHPQCKLNRLANIGIDAREADGMMIGSILSFVKQVTMAG